MHDVRLMVFSHLSSTGTSGQPPDFSHVAHNNNEYTGQGGRFVTKCLSCFKLPGATQGIDVDLGECCRKVIKKRGNVPPLKWNKGS